MIIKAIILVAIKIAAKKIIIAREIIKKIIAI